MDSIKGLLDKIDPATLNYQDWMKVGMALKEGGYSWQEWDDWSRRDPARYHAKDCATKWDSFQSSGITLNTLYKMAIDRGYKSPEYDNTPYEWDAVIPADKIFIDPAYLEETEVEEPKEDKWNPIEDITKYISTLFESTENVGYVTESWTNENGKHLPTKGNYDRTAGQLLQELAKASSIEDVFGDYDHSAGAWIRFNPLDGQGVKNDNVTDFRYALVESDSMDMAMQNTLIRKLELPVACLVNSGNKSIHAIVRVDAANYDEYRKRVNYLYDVCSKNGMEVDGQNKNPSRLSRMPGVIRGNNKQYLIDTNIGKKNWSEWEEWIEGINDDLPDPETLANDWDNIPDLAPALIEGVLRKGHKMLLSGASKAGKSFALIELCIAIAEGKKWLKWQCLQGKVLYINLELDRASCLHRFKDVYETLGIKYPHLNNIEIWNLRGNACPTDKLAPKLIRRASQKEYTAVVIDPIYKVITGDENSAEQMSKFCNQFDKIATSLNCAVIYCHHHSKGAQGSKRSMDRASGSGVFARDPDAMLDLTELPLTEEVRGKAISQVTARALADLIYKYDPDYYRTIPMEDLENDVAMQDYARKSLSPEPIGDRKLLKVITDARSKAMAMTAWRLDLTLREFAKPPEVNVWFDYPIHHVDTANVLTDLMPEEDLAPWQKGAKRSADKRGNPERKKIIKNQNRDDLLGAYDSIAENGESVTVKDLSEELGSSAKTIKRRLVENKDLFEVTEVKGKSNIVTKKAMS